MLPLKVVWIQSMLLSDTWANVSVSHLPSSQPIQANRPFLHGSRTLFPVGCILPSAPFPWELPLVPTAVGWSGWPTVLLSQYLQCAYKRRCLVQHDVFLLCSSWVREKSKDTDECMVSVSLQNIWGLSSKSYGFAQSWSWILSLCSTCVSPKLHF